LGRFVDSKSLVGFGLQIFRIFFSAFRASFRPALSPEAKMRPQLDPLVSGLVMRATIKEPPALRMNLFYTL